MRHQKPQVYDSLCRLPHTFAGFECVGDPAIHCYPILYWLGSESNDGL